MLKYVLSYEVTPGDNLPGGLPPQSLVVLSPVWRGPALTIEYFDGDTETLTGRTAGGEPGEVRVFWTRENPRGPAVCLAIGGDAGLGRGVKGGNPGNYPGAGLSGPGGEPHPRRSPGRHRPAAP